MLPPTLKLQLPVREKKEKPKQKEEGPTEKVVRCLLRLHLHLCLRLSASSWIQMLNIRSTGFSHFLNVAFEEISFLESTSGSIGSDRSKSSFFKLKSAVLTKFKTARYFMCHDKCMGRLYRF